MKGNYIARAAPFVQKGKRLDNRNIDPDIMYGCSCCIITAPLLYPDMCTVVGIRAEMRSPCTVLQPLHFQWLKRQGVVWFHMVKGTVKRQFRCNVALEF